MSQTPKISLRLPLAWSLVLLLGMAHWRYAGALLHLVTGLKPGWGPEPPWPAKAAALALFLWALSALRRPMEGSEAKSRIWILLIALFFFLGQRLLDIQAAVYPSVAPLAWLKAAAALSLGSALLFFWWGKEGPGLALVLLAFLLGQVRSMSAFPLETGFSDMLLLVRQGLEALAEGRSPYAPSGAMAHLQPYLPGTLFSFAPAHFLGLDLRWAHTAAVIAFAGGLALAAEPPRRGTLSLMLALFLVSPWLQFRHELYLGPFLLMLLAWAWALRRGNWKGEAVFMGLATATSQFAWLLWPLWLAAAWRGQGPAPALRKGALAACLALAILAPFALQEPAGFFDAVAAHWASALEEDFYCLPCWLGGPEALWMGLRLACVGLAVSLAWKSPEWLFGLGCALWVAFLAGSRYSQPYLYVNVLGLALIGLAFPRQEGGAEA